MTFKPSLVEHIFRKEWERSAAQAQEESDARHQNESDYDSDGSIEDRADVTDAHTRIVKIHQDAVKLSAEYLRLFAVEAFHRAQMEAMVDDSPTIEPHHVEQILAQLLLDY